MLYRAYHPRVVSRSRGYLHKNNFVHRASRPKLGLGAALLFLAASGRQATTRADLRVLRELLRRVKRFYLRIGVWRTVCLCIRSRYRHPLWTCIRTFRSNFEDMSLDHQATGHCHYDRQPHVLYFMHVDFPKPFWSRFSATIVHHVLGGETSIYRSNTWVCLLIGRPLGRMGRLVCFPSSSGGLPTFTTHPLRSAPLRSAPLLRACSDRGDIRTH